MQNTKSIIRKLADNKETIFKNYPLMEIGIFGSYVRGEQSSDSDLDILIDYDHRKRFSLLVLISLQNYLSELTQLKVDIALKRKLKTAMGYYILKEVLYI
jgi:hypothetical protein